jgi:transcriptional regulator with XRE-family HTH domain
MAMLAITRAVMRRSHNKKLTRAKGYKVSATTPTPPPAMTSPPSLAHRVEHQEFAATLRERMETLRLSASDLARRVWGEIKDSYMVARNRDRIGHYLAGVSFPDEDNLRKLAEVLEIPYDRLLTMKPAGGPAMPSIGNNNVGRGTVDTQLSILTGEPGLAVLQLRRKMRLATALKIIEMLKDDDENQAADPG